MDATWKYSDFHRFFVSSTAGPIVDQVRAATYENKFVAKKNNETSARENFKYESMVARRIPDETLGADTLRILNAKHGVFTVAPEKVTNQMSLYIVFPLLHKVESSSCLLADHFSFLRRPKDARGLRVHFHMTQYVPFPCNLERGNTIRYPCHLPDEFQLKDLKEKLSDHLIGLEPAIRQIFSVPLYPHTQSGAQRRGGGRRKKKSKIKIRERSDNETLNDLFRRLPLSKLVCIGCVSEKVEKKKTLDLTVFVEDRLYHTTPIRRALCIPSVPVEDSWDDHIARALSPYHWDDFYDVRVDE